MNAIVEELLAGEKHQTEHCENRERQQEQRADAPARRFRRRIVGGHFGDAGPVPPWDFAELEPGAG